MKRYATRKNAGKPVRTGRKGKGDGTSKAKLIIIASVLSSLAYFMLGRSSETPTKIEAPAKIEPRKQLPSQAVAIVETPKAAEASPSVNVDQLRSIGLGNVKFGFE